MNNRLIRTAAGLVLAAIVLGVSFNAFGPTLGG